LSDIPDEEKNGEANDYNDDYEDDFNPTRCRELLTLSFVLSFYAFFIKVKRPLVRNPGYPRP